ncbi:acyltransferase [Singulisphaera sp. Ch08]|uniref:Acyltransferase n=1 Tax=Singulisphaera sp. Ch08 TaxID=3120278 RepID=A0AAU7CF36_9BACT
MSVRQRLDYLDGVRGAAALYVTACHAYLTYANLFLRRSNGELGDALLHGMQWLNYGRSAVAVFIVISGYCLMLPVAQSEDGKLAGGTLGFFLRRARRLLPPYYGALLVSLVLIATVPGMGESDTSDWHQAFWIQVFPAFTPGVILSHLLLVHNYNPHWQHAIDYPMWSLATEWQILLLFPIFVAIWNRATIGDAVMAAMRITLGLQVGLIVFAPDVNPWPPQFVTLFALGMAAATVNYPRSRDPIPARQRPWGRLAALLFGLYVILEMTVGHWLLGTGRQQVPDLVVGGGTACLLVYCTGAVKAGSRPWILQRFESCLLSGVGKFSYSLYLIHAPVLAVVFLVLQACRISCVGTQILMLSLGIALSLLASYGFHCVFERPFLRSERRPIRFYPTIRTSEG